ncbi:NAD(P)H-dependent oxidoreductase [Nocardioides renjunii]|uniref:NAD(P)H-dependent oxidoreductase n=1 Tax=Nocardioides renjunii TaxID=3095075 RepID=UPI002AFFEDC5|nr:NAD(P)H-dependent oxidoreductase [Nocardioides sp. S-34]WQQ21693.1 NAD(P)H-dependent oxidoreductase [Nocardioides sp. S-34]
MATVLVIDAHPDPSSLTAQLAASYAAGAGDTAVTLVLRDLDFDLTLRTGYRTPQDLEPDLARAQELLEWADHVAVFTPVWWGSVPALLKGFFDRTLERGWAFRYRENGMPEGLLAGRTGRLAVTSDSPRWYLPLVGDTTVKQVRGRTMEFCGIKPTRLTRYADVRNRTEDQLATWIRDAADLGALDAARPARPAAARPELAAAG